MISPSLPADLEDLGGDLPDWLVAAVFREREEGFVSAAGCEIHYIAWGDRDKPALVFTHGRMSHARCWAFVAPLLADRYRCVAFDLSGMGDSGRRDFYAYADRAEEALAVTDAVVGGDPQPLLVSHSYGAVVALNALRRRPDRFRGLIACDPSFTHPDEWSSLTPREEDKDAVKPHRVYEDLKAAVARFRLAPPQSCEMPVLLEYLARHSLKAGPDGWRWKFDPKVYSRFEEGHNDWWVGHSQDFVALEQPKAIIYGEESAFINRRVAEAIAVASTPASALLGIPVAHHHLMVDQPVALAVAIAAMAERLG